MNHGPYACLHGRIPLKGAPAPRSGTPPDGHTIFVGQASNLAINLTLIGKLPYDPVKDFAPVTLIAQTPNLLVVHPSLPVRSVKESGARVD